jgi:predicted porin
LRSAGRSADREIKLLGELLMKKHLIAAAVAAAVAAPAFAQNVELYGRFDQAYYNTKATAVNGTTTKVTNTGLDGGVGGSRLGFRGTEDLGGGLKAGFVFEYGTDVGENSGIGATRLGFAQLQGGFGTIRVGRQVSPVKAILDGFRASGNNTNFRPGDLYFGGASHLNADNRVSNAVTYVTPSMSGFSAQIQTAEVVTKTAAGSVAGTGSPVVSGQSESLGYSLNYSAGPLALAVGVMELDAKQIGAPTSTKDELTTFAASYKFGFATLSAMYSEREVKTTTKTNDHNLWTIGAIVPLAGAWSANLEYSDGEEKAIGATAKADVSGYKLRANYAFSKRTSIYAIIGEDERKQGNAKTKNEGYAIGLVHTF